MGRLELLAHLGRNGPQRVLHDGRGRQRGLDAGDDGARLGRAAGAHEPARRLGQDGQQQDGLDEGGDGAEADHPAPGEAGVDVGGEQPAEDVGDDLAKSDKQDVDRHEAAAVGGRADLGNVEGDDEAGGADGSADNGAAEDHGGDGGAGGLQEGAGDKEDVGGEDDMATAARVGEDGGGGRGDEGQQRRAGGDDGLVDGGQGAVGEGSADGDERGRDDASIVWW